MNQPTDTRTVPQLLSDLARELTTLFRKEGQLIRAELSEKFTQVQIGAGSALAGAVVLLVALNVLAAALVAALASIGRDPNYPSPGGLGVGWASLIVGVLLAIAGALLVKKGASSMSNLTPERSAHQVAQDANLVKEQVR